MATQDEKSQIAVLQSQMQTVIKGIEGINSKLDNQAGLYVTQAEFKEFKQRWFLSHTLAAFAGAVIAGVVTYWLTR